MRNTFFRYFMAAFVLYALSIGALAQVKAFDTSRMDRNADACDDFFEFANGTWVKNTEIPPSETRWGTFNILSAPGKGTRVIVSLPERGVLA